MITFKSSTTKVSLVLDHDKFTDDASGSHLKIQISSSTLTQIKMRYVSSKELRELAKECERLAEEASYAENSRAMLRSSEMRGTGFSGIIRKSKKIHVQGTYTYFISKRSRQWFGKLWFIDDLELPLGPQKILIDGKTYELTIIAYDLNGDKHVFTFVGADEPPSGWPRS